MNGFFGTVDRWIAAAEMPRYGDGGHQIRVLSVGASNAIDGNHAAAGWTEFCSPCG
jgi:hypothetical protein